MPLFTIRDDNGNPLNLGNTVDVLTGGKIKGKSKKVNPLTGKQYPIGYTPQSDFIGHPEEVGANGIPKEFGEYPDLSKLKNKTTPLEKRNKIRSDSDNFNDNINHFKHGYDYVFNEKGEASAKLISESYGENKDNSVYLGGYAHTGNENEDPTYFGYDVIIDIDNSPLFNGALQNFITTYSSMSEIKSRMEIYIRFKELFFRIFRANDYTEITSLYNKGHYLKKISGLNALTESTTHEDSRLLTDYGKDIITIGINEDVEMLLNELFYLYKTLAYSKINGKQLIPPNLLRFNCEIVVSEVRRFKRVYRLLNNQNTVTTDSADNQPIQSTTNGTGIYSMSIGSSGDISPLGEGTNGMGVPNYAPKSLSDIENSAIEKMQEINDLVSKIRYKLYECTLFTQNLSHEDSIDLTAPEMSNGSELTFKYKFTSSIYEKITWGYVNRQYKPNIFSINNSSYDLQSNDASQNVLTTENDIIKTDIWELYTKTNLLDDIIESPIDQLIKNNKLENNPAETLKKKLIASLNNEINRQIVKRLKIVNKAFTNIRNGLGLGQISEPTNIYDGDYYERMLNNDVRNSLRDFVGDSLRNYLDGGN
jgi:hypothetical protein